MVPDGFLCWETVSGGLDKQVQFTSQHTGPAAEPFQVRGATPGFWRLQSSWKVSGLKLK